jgi:hypothetical protein
MRKLSRKMKMLLSQVDRHTINLIITVAILILFVLAAGAPNGMGGIGMQSLDKGDSVGQCQMSETALAHMSLKSPVQLCVQ